MATSRSDATLSPHRAEEGIPRDFELAGNEDDTSSNEVRPNTWDGPQDAQNPLNWKNRRKWINVILISIQAMLSPVSCTILAVGSENIAQDFGLTSSYTPNLPVGMFVLGVGLGPLCLAPLSELHGRRIVYLYSFTLFTITNVGCALSPGIIALSILRVLAGIFGSAGPTLGGASIGDMFQPKDRGRAQALYALGPTFGNVIGPLVGAFILNGTHNWRWLLWPIVISSGITVVFSVLFLRETYTPFLLRQKAERLRKTRPGNTDVGGHKIRTKKFSGKAITRPFYLLFFSPVCTTMSLYMSLIYGILFLHLITIPLLYGPSPVYGLFSYRWQNGITGLAYLGAGIGILIGTLICAIYLNRSYSYMAERRLRKTGSHDAQPESRMLFLQIGMAIVPAGLILFAWSAEKHFHWVIPLLGATIFSTGMLMAYVCIQTYLVDVYSIYAASALAGMIAARSVASCAFAITGFQLYVSLGYGWGTMLIAFICIAMLPIPLLLYRYGPRLRSKDSWEGAD